MIDNDDNDGINMMIILLAIITIIRKSKII